MIAYDATDPTRFGCARFWVGRVARGATVPTRFGQAVSGRVDRVRREGSDPVQAGSYRVGMIAHGVTVPTRFERVSPGLR
jgi:hypothetical protein